MGISGAQPVGLGNTQPAQAPSVPQKPADTAAVLSSSTTQTQTQTQTSTQISSFVSQLPNDSPLRAFLEQMTAMELQSLILNMLLGQQKEEDNNSADKVLAMALLGSLIENRDPRSTLFFSSVQTESMNMSVVSTEQAITAYANNQMDPQTAADPGSQTTAVTNIDTVA